MKYDVVLMSIIGWLLYIKCVLLRSITINTSGKNPVVQMIRTGILSILLVLPNQFPVQLFTNFMRN